MTTKTKEMPQKISKDVFKKTILEDYRLAVEVRESGHKEEEMFYLEKVVLESLVMVKN